MHAHTVEYCFCAYVTTRLGGRKRRRERRESRRRTRSKKKKQEEEEEEQQEEEEEDRSIYLYLICNTQTKEDTTGAESSFHLSWEHLPLELSVFHWSWEHLPLELSVFHWSWASSTGAEHLPLELRASSAGAESIYSCSCQSSTEHIPNIHTASSSDSLFANKLVGPRRTFTLPHKVTVSHCLIQWQSLWK